LHRRKLNILERQDWPAHWLAGCGVRHRSESKNAGEQDGQAQSIHALAFLI
jgi:hypothetical protein